MTTPCSTPECRPILRTKSVRAFTSMEVLVTIAIVLVLSAITVPVVSAIRQRAHKQVALEKMRLLGGALMNYTSANSGSLPLEDAGGNDSWDKLAKPGAKDAWYNTLPRLISRKGAGDFATSPSSFYTDENLVYLPGANYPDKKKLASPQFAIAFNTKLERKEAGGEKKRTKMDQITQPAKTVALLEQGVMNESRTLAVQSKKDYDGSPKGSAKSFVGRYAGQGVLYFLDGHAELVAAKELLTETGQFPYPQTDVIWTATPEENPNKDGLTVAAKKKSKN